jgi:hypothetical protein
VLENMVDLVGIEPTTSSMIISRERGLSAMAFYVNSAALPGQELPAVSWVNERYHDFPSTNRE